MIALCIALALAVAGAALAACGEAPTPTPPPTPTANIVAWIGDHALTHAEFTDTKRSVAESVARMERDLLEVFPNHETDVEREFYDKALKEWPERIAAIKRYGYDTVAFAELLYEYALVAAAIREGFTVSDKEKADFIAQQTDILDMGLNAPEFKTEAEQFLADIGGREAFLSKLTLIAERGFLISKYLNASYQRLGIESSSFGDSSARNAATFKVANSAVAAIDIEMTGMPPIATSPEKAIAYMNEAEVFVTPAFPSSTSTLAPAPTAAP